MAAPEDTRTTIGTGAIDSLLGSSWLARVFGLVVGLSAWTALASVFPNQLMPYPYETALVAVGLVQQGVVSTHVSATFWRMLVGFLGAWVIGIGTGIVMGASDYGEKFLLPSLTIGLAFPAVSWAAITTLVFGFGDLAPIVATVLITFPYITVNVWKGVEDINPERLRMSSAFGVSRTRLLVRLVLPSIAPALFTAFRYAIAIAWKIVTISEMFASSSGVGYKLVEAYETYRYEEAWAWAVLFMLIILGIEFLFVRPLERRFFQYRDAHSSWNFF